MFIKTSRSRKIGIVLLIGLCTFITLITLKLVRIALSPPPPPSSSSSSWPFLEANYPTDDILYSWAMNNLQSLRIPPEPWKETVLFWTIPKTGTSTAKSFYKCMDQTITNDKGVKPRFGHHEDKELAVFRPFKTLGYSFVNVDTTTDAGIIRAQELGLVPSGLADIIFTGDPNFAVEHLYDSSHKGRMLGMFRHPVERLISLYYYSRVATWEKNYRAPDVQRNGLFKYAKGMNGANSNHMLRKLSGKASVTEDDLLIAMRTVKQRLIVGLTDQMEESIRRFNIVIGIDRSVKNNECMIQHFGKDAERVNSNSHPKPAMSSRVWHLLAEKNALDIRLYDHLVHLFEEQKEIIEFYSKSMVGREE